MKTHGKAALSLAGAAAFAIAIGGCGSSNDSSSSSTGTPAAGSAKGGTIALLLPESKTTRYESQDKPLFEKKVASICSNCKVIYSNADQDSSKQQAQAEAAITNGAKVLVLDPVDADAAATIAKTAKTSNIPVISYDRLISGPDVSYYISYDNTAVGKLQATSLLQQLGNNGTGKSIVMINGAPTDPNAALFKSGAHAVFAKSGVKIAKEYDTPDWSPDKAQSEMDQAIAALGKNGFQGVYAANDGNAGAAVASMKSAGIDPSKIPSTGQDAEIAGVQRILAGQQGMTVYKAIKPEAEDAATLAVALVNGQKPPAGLVNTTQNNKTINVPSIIFKPVAVTKANVNSTIIKDGFWTPAQICTAAYVADCKAAGITTS